MNTRKTLCADALIDGVRSVFSKVPDHRGSQKAIALVDSLMSGFAVFSLKKSSLLEFDRDRLDPTFVKNMKSLYGVDKVPSDTAMRETLDEVDPISLKPAFKYLFRTLQRGKCLEGFRFLDDKYLVVLDGTGYFSSKKVHCENCLTKTSRKTGETSYQHQLVGSVIIHPDEKVVIPLCPEPIIKQDGSTKNDCERNAVARWLDGFRRDHPKLKVIITEDGLASNAPHIHDLVNFGCSFILIAKPGDHKFLFEQVHLLAGENKELITHAEGSIHTFRYINGVPLNESNQESKVNFLEYSELDKKGKKRNFTWVTDIKLNDDNVFDIMKGGRARWSVENETFNTLKNQGYNLGHNFGHGYKNLSVVLVLLMFLAFTVDQIQQYACRVFQEAKSVAQTFKNLWKKIRSWFDLTEVPCWKDLFTVIASKTKMDFPDTS